MQLSSTNKNNKNNKKCRTHRKNRTKTPEQLFDNPIALSKLPDEAFTKAGLDKKEYVSKAWKKYHERKAEETEFKMKELTSYNPSGFIEETRTMEGKLKLLDDLGMDNLHKNIGLYYQLQAQLIQNLSYNMKCYYTNISAATTNLENVQKDFEILSMLNSKVLLKEEIIANYKQLGIFIKNWRRVLFNQNEIMKKYIRDFYKYVKMEGNAFKELIYSWDELKKKFDTENKRLITKKEKLWTQMDVAKWEITEDFLKIDRLLLFRDNGYAFAKMCTAETKSVNSLQNLLSYANYMNNSQLKELIDKQSQEMIKNTMDFCNEIYPTLTDMLDVWSNLNGVFQIG